MTRLLEASHGFYHPIILLRLANGWLPKEDNGTIQSIFHISRLTPLEATLYHKDPTERIHCVEQYSLVPRVQLGEVRIIRCGGPKRIVIDYNPTEDAEDAEVEELTLWMWGQDWISNLDWDPKDWQWRRIGILADTTVLNYTTKRGYRAALQQNHHQMKLDAELETSGFNSKARAKFFNRIWHRYLPRKVSAIQWLILTEGLPVGAWRERIGLPSQVPTLPTTHPRNPSTCFSRASRDFQNMGTVQNLE